MNINVLAEDQIFYLVIHIYCGINIGREGFALVGQVVGQIAFDLVCKFLRKAYCGNLNSIQVGKIKNIDGDKVQRKGNSGSNCRKLD